MVEDRDQAVARLRTTAPDVIVVDVNGSTLALLDWLRGADGALCAAAIDTPVIVLTSRSEEVHWVRLLERGGDDVIVKPFSHPELRARIGAVLRRTMPRQPRPVLTAGPVQIDVRGRRVTVHERPVELSAVEYRLLCHLAGEPTRVLTNVNFELPDAEGRHGELRRCVDRIAEARTLQSRSTHQSPRISRSLRVAWVVRARCDAGRIGSSLTSVSEDDVADHVGKVRSVDRQDCLYPRRTNRWRAGRGPHFD